MQHFPTKGNGTQPRGPASQLHSLHLGTQQIGSLQRAPFNIETDAADMCCASCSIAEVDDIKLKNCDACDLVRYP
eukprot:scaffold948_cov74-Skeletonema_dohrnii-CCMP3373.AAC.1